MSVKTSNLFEMFYRVQPIFGGHSSQIWPQIWCNYLKKKEFYPYSEKEIVYLQSN